MVTNFIIVSSLIYTNRIDQEENQIIAVIIKTGSEKIVVAAIYCPPSQIKRRKVFSKS